MKKILIIGYEFYGYQIEIVEELKKNYEVEFISVNLNKIESIILKVLEIFKIKEKLKVTKILKQRKITIKKFKKNCEIDYLMILGEFNFLEEYLKILNKNFIIKQKILYLWDSVNRIENFTTILPILDKIYSFDKEDAIKYNLIYRPTFYSKRLIKENKQRKYEICFVGNYSVDREKLLLILSRYFSQKYFKLKLGKIAILKYYFKIYKFSLKEIKEHLKNITLVVISRKKYNKIMSESDVILELLQFEQTGVTQRTLDAIYLGKKLITNNPYIKNYNFYHKNNILIINDNTSKEEIENFKKLEYVKISDEIIDYYSIEQWAKDIFEGDR